jgi:RecT family
MSDEKKPDAVVVPSGASAAPKALQVYAPAPLVPSNLDEAWRLSQYMAKSSLVPASYRNQPENVMIAIMMGIDLGISATQAMREVYVVEGRPASSALLKVALVKQSPLCESWDLIESTERQCTIETKRKGGKPYRHTYTLEDARTAGLYPGKDSSNWSKRPKLMMRRRCESELADEVYPDVTKGLRTEDEIQEIQEREIQGERVFREVVTTTAPPIPEDPPAPRVVEAKAVEVVKPEPVPAKPREAEAVTREGPKAEQIRTEGPDPVDVALTELGMLETMKAVDEFGSKLSTLVPKGHPRRQEIGDAVNAARRRVKQ